MENEIHRLRKQLEDFRELDKSLSKIFTETQIKILKSGKRSEFNSCDISAAICLHKSGPRAYRHLHKKGFPLPSRPTLYRWLSNVNIKSGTLDVVIDLMGNEQMDEIDKLSVLTFREIKVADAFEYDSAENIVYDPNCYVQLAIVRGIKKAWKQPIFFDYNTRMNVDTLKELITKLHKRGYPVAAIVSELNAENERLWRELGISESKCGN